MFAPELPVGFPEFGSDSDKGKTRTAKVEAWFNRFEIRRVLQRTGNSVVVQARDLHRNEEVALKVSPLDECFRGDEDKVESPVEEIRMHSVLGEISGNIVRLLDHGVDHKEGKIWQSLEFCAGGDLFDFASQSGAMPEEEAKSIARQVLAAIKVLHDKGFAHMDVSLENFLLTKDNTIKLCDFGMMAKDDGAIKGPRGKVLYMAPEVALGIQGFSGAKADVFSFGVVLYALLTGVLPFEKPSFRDPCYMLICKNEVKKVIRGQEVDNKVSAMAQDLFSHLLCLEQNRFTVDQILRHAWFATKTS